MCGLISLLIFGFLAYTLYKNSGWFGNKGGGSKGSGIYKNTGSTRRYKKNNYLKGRY